MFRLHCNPGLADTPDTACIERLKLVADRTLSCHPAGGLVDVILTDDDEIRRLNGSFRGRDQATDVLSFSFVAKDGTGDTNEFVHAEDIPAGEVYISFERAGAQARDYGVPHDEELARLLVHGLLHLAGYDHQTETELCVMEQLTEGLLAVKPDLSWPTDSPKGV
jgi:probable rRNA maturation factor